MLRALALCGAIASAASAAAAAGGLPSYHGCATPLALSHSYCNLSLSHLQRVDSLLALLTLEEKVGLIAPDPSMGDTCFAHIHAIPRVGLPEYGWLVETNTGVASQCLGPGRCATTFSGPTGLGASFNRSVWSQKGNVLSTEMRAFSNARWIRGIGTSYPGHIESTASFIGTSAFGPNLNIIRDPRYGRNSELPSEDPFLTGELGKAEVIAMQTTDVAGHPRVNAYLKHFTAYSTETNRMHSDFNMTDFDLFDTYLPQYEKVFTEANTAGAMCSYNAENGHPSCANSFLLNDVLRKRWQRPDAYITTDCTAVSNTMGPPLSLKTKEEAAAATINAGTDLEMGSDIWNSSMLSAHAKGLVTEATIDTAARRALMQRFSQGDFDPVVQPPPPETCSIAPVHGMDSVGTSVYSTGHVNGGLSASAEACHRLCCRTLGKCHTQGCHPCDTWTFAVKDGSTVGQCWLKTLGNLTQTDNCKPGGGYSCTSGKVKNHFPALGPYDVTWSEIGTDVVNSTVHQEIAYQAALQSMVLLKNDKAPSGPGLLPLKPGGKIAVVGPTGVSSYAMLSDYFGDMVCYEPHELTTNKSYSCIPTIASQIAAMNKGGVTTAEAGVDVMRGNTSGIPRALALVDDADVVILALGIDRDVEHEDKDRHNTTLSDPQEQLALAVLAKQKPTVLVIVGDDIDGIDNLIEGSAAIVKAFYPGVQGAKALAAQLFGTENRWGKLPVTMYPMDYIDQLPRMGDHDHSMSMSYGVGRSYRYYRGEVLMCGESPCGAFGYGMSLTTFNLSCDPVHTHINAQRSAADPPSPAEPIYRRLIVACTVTNTGTLHGDEVLQVYHVPGATVRKLAGAQHPVPLKSLVEFERVSLAPNEATTWIVSLDPSKALALTTANGSKVVYPGEHTVVFTTGSDFGQSVNRTVLVPAQ